MARHARSRFEDRVVSIKEPLRKWPWHDLGRLAQEQPAPGKEVQRNTVVLRGALGLAQVLPVPGAKTDKQPEHARASRAVRSEPARMSAVATSYALM